MDDLGIPLFQETSMWDIHWDHEHLQVFYKWQFHIARVWLTVWPCSWQFWHDMHDHGYADPRPFVLCLWRWCNAELLGQWLWLAGCLGSVKATAAMGIVLLNVAYHKHVIWRMTMDYGRILPELRKSRLPEKREWFQRQTCTNTSWTGGDLLHRVSYSSKMAKTLQMWATCIIYLHHSATLNAKLSGQDRQAQAVGHVSNVPHSDRALPSMACGSCTRDSAEGQSFVRRGAELQRVSAWNCCSLSL